MSFNLRCVFLLIFLMVDVSSPFLMSPTASVILIHELGHYLAALSLNIKVEEFSVGFGPAVVRFQINPFRFVGGEEEEEEGRVTYSLRALPIGGYVKFPENYNTTLVMENDLAAREGFKKKLSTEKKEGGIVGLLKWLNEEDENTVLKKKTKKPPKNSPKKEKKPPPPIEYYTDVDLLQNRPWPDRALVLSAGVVFNFLLSFSLYFVSLTVGPGLTKTIIEEGVLVTTEPIENSPSYGILRKGDVISSFNGENLLGLGTDVTIMESEISKIISTIKSTEDGANVEVERKEGGTVKIKPRVAMGRQYPTIGVSLSPNFVGVEKVKTSSAAEAAKLSVEEVKKVTKSTANGLANFFKSLVQFGGKGKSGAGGSISGPVGVIKLGSDVIGSKDWSALINFAAAISINLGVVNALPLPSLDGGQLGFVVVEAIRKKKIEQKTLDDVNAIALFGILVLSLGTVFTDTLRLFGK
ncbi:hypothetical protein TrST_g13687 [Triparma strigata]|uniref:Peptidase M50 domain-containing protein n=1 Tax=Triparma strigata TaxID=1606541 RepID=A0A9W7BUC3_9STRA|nr:hypothetical protein TrST_g13687 [Triparma strigata]